MNLALLVVGVPVIAAFVAAIALFGKERTVWSLLQLIGAACLVVVIFAHVAEAYHLFPRMGWGLSDSAGHYLDLISAVAGLILFSAGYLSRRLARRRNSS